MRNHANQVSRRSLIQFAGAAAAGCLIGASVPAAESPSAVSLFDGKTLDGWLQIENSATSLSAGGITDAAAFAARLTGGQDTMSVYLRGRLQDSVKADLAGYS